MKTSMLGFKKLEQINYHDYIAEVIIIFIGIFSVIGTVDDIGTVDIIGPVNGINNVDIICAIDVIIC